ncbi:hypothetical protein MSAN_00295100 [Mycena sanguinolenta]|uniref:Uncharacterized protein n=1 Tax=Mycena sanguinolenta TaxID=230812 RepID=A0A8H6ZB37_9AGAR|nr:hypothetical protein MSAN_00295100 [Mycena sanguinolenta]
MYPSPTLLRPTSHPCAAASPRHSSIAGTVLAATCPRRYMYFVFMLAARFEAKVLFAGSKAPCGPCRFALGVHLLSPLLPVFS